MKTLAATLAILRFYLKKVEGEEEYTMFGSAPLCLRNVIDRDPGDIDVMVTRRVWGALLPEPGFYCYTPDKGNPPILVNEFQIPIHLFFDWSDPYVGIDPNYLLKNYEEVEGWRVITLQETLRQKEAALNRARDGGYYSKHTADIEAIEGALSVATIYDNRPV